MNKKSTVTITIVGIVALVIAIIGATYAYFTAQVRYVGPPGGSDVVARAATLGEIIFDAGPGIELINAFPGDSAHNTFTIAADSDATNGVAYEIRIRITENNFENISKHYSGHDVFGDIDHTTLRIRGNQAGSLSGGESIPFDDAFGIVNKIDVALPGGRGYVKEGQIGEFVFATETIMPGQEHTWFISLDLNTLGTSICENFVVGCASPGNPFAPPRTVTPYNTNFDQGKSFRATIEIVPTEQYTALNRPPVAP